MVLNGFLAYSDNRSTDAIAKRHNLLYTLRIISFDATPHAITKSFGLLHLQKRLEPNPTPPQLPVSVLIAVSVCAFVGAAVFVAAIVVLIGRYHERRTLRAHNRASQHIPTAIANQALHDIEGQYVSEKANDSVGDVRRSVHIVRERPTPSPMFDFSPPSPNWQPQLHHQNVPATAPTELTGDPGDVQSKKHVLKGEVDGVYTFGLSFPLPPSDSTKGSDKRATYIAQSGSHQIEPAENTKVERPTSSPPVIMSTDVSYNTIAGLSVSEESEAGLLTVERRFSSRKLSLDDRVQPDLKQQWTPEETGSEAQSSASKAGLGIATLDSDVSLLASSSRVFIAPLVPFAPFLAENVSQSPKTSTGVRRARSQRSLGSADNNSRSATNQIKSKLNDVKAKLERKKSTASIHENTSEALDGKRSRRAGVIGTANGLILTPHLPPLNLPSLFSPADLADVGKEGQLSETVAPPSESQSSYLTVSDSTQSTNASARTNKAIIFHDASLQSIAISSASQSSDEKPNSELLAHPPAGVNKTSGLSAYESSNSMITASSTESSARSYSAYLSESLSRRDAPLSSKDESAVLVKESTLPPIGELDDSLRHREESKPMTNTLNEAKRSLQRQGSTRSQQDTSSSPLLPLSFPSPIPPFLTVEDPDGHRSDTASYEARTSNVPRPVVWSASSTSPHKNGLRNQHSNEVKIDGGRTGSPRRMNPQEHGSSYNQKLLGFAKKKIDASSNLDVQTGEGSGSARVENTADRKVNVLNFNDDLARFLANQLRPGSRSPSLSSTRSPLTQRRISLKSFKSLLNRSDSRASSLLNSPAVSAIPMTEQSSTAKTKSGPDSVRPLSVKTKEMDPISKTHTRSTGRKLPKDLIMTKSLEVADSNTIAGLGSSKKTAAVANDVWADTRDYTRRKYANAVQPITQTTSLLPKLTDRIDFSPANTSPLRGKEAKPDISPSVPRQGGLSSHSPVMSLASQSSTASFHLRHDRDWFLRESLTPRFQHLQEVLGGDHEVDMRLKRPLEELPPLPPMPSIGSLSDYRRLDNSKSKTDTVTPDASLPRLPSSLGLGLPLNDSQWTLEAIDNESEDSK